MVAADTPKEALADRLEALLQEGEVSPQRLAQIARAFARLSDALESLEEA